MSNVICYAYRKWRGIIAITRLTKEKYFGYDASSERPVSGPRAKLLAVFPNEADARAGAARYARVVNAGTVRLDELNREFKKATIAIETNARVALGGADPYSVQ